MRLLLDSLLVSIILVLTLAGVVDAGERYRRIVSLAPSITEILFALGLEESIAGVTNFCDYPPEAKTKPKIGGMSNPSVEAILRLSPDLVILTTDGNPKYLESRLGGLGIRTYVFRARRISELPGGIKKLGSFLGVPNEAGNLSARIETVLRDYAGKQPSTGRSQKVLFIIWPDPLIVAGPGTEIDDVLGILGLQNIAHDAPNNYPRYSLEEVIRRDPDIIFIGKGHADMKEVAGRILKRLASLRAVKEGSVYFVSDALYRLGPRVIEGIRELAGYLK